MNSIIKTISLVTILLSISYAQATVSHARQVDKDRETAQKNYNSYMYLLARLTRTEQDIASLEENIRQNNSSRNFALAMKQECDAHCARQDLEELQDELFMANLVRTEMHPTQR